MAGYLLNVAYLIPVAVRAFMPEPGQPGSANRSDGAAAWRVEEAPMLCVVPLCITAVGCLLLFLFADRLFEFLMPIAAG